MAYTIVGSFMGSARTATAETAEEACEIGDEFFRSHASSVAIRAPDGMPYSVELLRQTLEDRPDA